MFLRIFPLFLLTTLFFSGPAAAEAPAVKGGKCPRGSTVIVEVRGVKLRVPRTASYRVTLQDKKTKLALGRPHKDYDCSTPLISHARGITHAQYEIGIAERVNATQESFDNFRKVVAGAPKVKGSLSVNIKGGMIRTSAPALGAMFFELPLDKAPTFDSVPVVFMCDNSVEEALTKIIPRICKTAYLHPSGLPFIYDVLWSDYPDDDFLKADQEKRKLLEEMIEAEKSEKLFENKDK